MLSPHVPLARIGSHGKGYGNPQPSQGHPLNCVISQNTLLLPRGSRVGWILENCPQYTTVSKKAKPPFVAFDPELELPFFLSSQCSTWKRSRSMSAFSDCFFSNLVGSIISLRYSLNCVHYPRGQRFVFPCNQSPFCLVAFGHHPVQQWESETQNCISVNQLSTFGRGTLGLQEADSWHRLGVLLFLNQLHYIEGLVGLQGLG